MSIEDTVKSLLYNKIANKIFNYIYNNNYEKLKKIIDESNINIKNEYNETAIMVACRFNILKIVIFLLKYKNIDLTIKDVEGYTPFLYVCKYGHLDIIKVLINKVKLDTTNYYEKNALIIAYENKHLYVVDYLIKTKPEMFLNFLYNACKNNYLYLVKKLVEQNKYINKDILFITCINNCFDIFKYLLKNTNYDINWCDSRNNNLLLIACKKNYLNIVKYLIKKTKINIHLQNNEKNNALLIASKKNNTDIIRYLVSKTDIDINVTNIKNKNLLYYCYKYDNYDIIENKNFYFPINSKENEKILLNSCYYNHIHIVKKLYYLFFRNIQYKEILVNNFKYKFKENNFFPDEISNIILDYLNINSLNIHQYIELDDDLCKLYKNGNVTEIKEKINENCLLVYKNYDNIIYIACENNDIDFINFYIKKYEHEKYYNSYKHIDYTKLLLYPCLNNNLQIFKLLIEFYKKINVKYDENKILKFISNRFKKYKDNLYIYDYFLHSNKSLFDGNINEIILDVKKEVNKIVGNRLIMNIIDIVYLYI